VLIKEEEYKVSDKESARSPKNAGGEIGGNTFGEDAGWHGDGKP